MINRRFLPFALVVAVVVAGLSFRCAKAGGGASTPYVIKPRLVKATDGAVQASVAIEVAPGWHWNPDYPFSLAVNEAQGVALGKTKFAAPDVRVAGDGASATVDLGSLGKVEAGARMKGLINFGVCDAKVCQFCRKCEVEWTSDAIAP